MQKFECGCGRKVRDVYFKNGSYMCVKCFWQGCESPYDYIINLLAAKGLVITFKDQPVLVLKQFSADQLAEKEAIVRPDTSWVIVPGDDFWMNFSGSVEHLRNYISTYEIKRDDSCCSGKED